MRGATAGNAENGGGRGWSRWRIAGWGLGAAIVLHPLIAMPFTNEVNWDETDFILAAALVGGVGLALELAVRRTASIPYRAAVGITLAAAFLLVWINLAVGIIGSEENPANLIYFGVVAVAVTGAAIARFRPGGMARALLGAAIAQGLVFAIALIAGLGFTGPITVFFGGLWLLSAWLFRRAAREEERSAA